MNSKGGAIPPFEWSERLQQLRFESGMCYAAAEPPTIQVFVEAKLL